MTDKQLELEYTCVWGILTDGDSSKSYLAKGIHKKTKAKKNL